MSGGTGGGSSGSSKRNAVVAVTVVIFGCLMLLLLKVLSHRAGMGMLKYVSQCGSKSYKQLSTDARYKVALNGEDDDDEVIFAT